MHDDIVHDFNNLLQVIQARGELIRTDLDAADPRRPEVDELLAATDRAQRLVPRLHAPRVSGESLHGNEVVLVVEDDRDARRVVCDILELFGYTVYQAADGGAALRMLDYLHPAPDLLLTDLMLPELSGLEVIHELSARRKLPRVLMMSACNTLPPHDVAAVEIPFIARPFPVEALARRVRELLDQEVSTRPSVVRS